ncbi:hypothetical protein ACXGQW_03385 [Wenyingzhuangia sp. IMCC45533]
MNNDNKISKFLTALIFIIAVIGFVLFALVYVADTSSLGDAVSPFVEFSVWLLYASLIITVVFAIVNIIKNPEDLKKIVVNVLVLGAVFAVAYFTASDAAVLDVQGQILEGGEAGSTSKMISTLINFSTFLGIIALAVVGLGSIKSAIK